MLHTNITISAPSPKPSYVRSSVETPLTTPSSYIYLKAEEIDYHCSWVRVTRTGFTWKFNLGKSWGEGEELTIFREL